MHILYTTQTLLPFTGYGRYSRLLISQIQERGHSVKVLIPYKASIPSEFSSIAYPVLKHNPTQPLSHPFGLLADNSTIRSLSKQADLIHFLTESPLASAFLGYTKPYAVTTHGTWAIAPLVANPISRRVFSRGYNRAKKVVSISQYTRSRLEEFNPDADYEVIHHGISLTNGKLQQKTFKINPIKLLTVAALHPSKGIDYSLKAAIELFRQKHQVEYTVVSGKVDSAYKDYLNKLAQNSGFTAFNIEERVSDDRLAQLYQQADVFLLTPPANESDFEGFGLIFLEAAKCGLPIVATNVAAIPEVLTKLGISTIAMAENIDSIVALLQTMIHHPELMQKTSQLVQKNIHSFDITVMVNQYIKLYEDICNH